MRQLVLIAHNIRSAHNVGSLLRTADGLGIKKVILTGYTPYPHTNSDQRLPHLAAKADRAIAKTALGAEKTVPWEHYEQLRPAVAQLTNAGFSIIALEQANASIPIKQLKPPAKVAVIVGSETKGLAPSDLSLAQQVVEIPMRGHKESFNVAVAAAIALFALSDK